MIHVAITRRVRPGHEQEFETRLTEFFRAAETHPETGGAFMLRPLEGEGHVYGIVRAFKDEAAQKSFYASQLYADWNRTVSDMVEGPPDKRTLHGLEAFFRNDPVRPPAAWKMAIVTWIAVNPAVFIFAHGVPSLVKGLPMLAELLLVNAFVVAALTWVFMPVLVRVFDGWLHPS